MLNLFFIKQKICNSECYCKFVTLSNYNRANDEAGWSCVCVAIDS